MELRIKSTALVLSLCLINTSGHANEHSDFQVSANAAIVSDYVFRGITQSDENFAIQGGFDAAHQSGLHTGVWASTVDFNDGDEASTEIDLYAGFSSTFGDISYDIGGIYYAYPGADTPREYDYWEIYGSLGYDFDKVSTSLSLNYSPDYYNESGDAFYTHLGIDVPLPQNLTLISGIGYQTIDDNASFGIGKDNYTDWNVGLGYDWRSLNFSVTYHDTNLDEPGECADGCESRLVFNMSTEFGI